MGHENRLTLEDRQTIERLLKIGQGYHQIGRVLKRTHSCIRNEVIRSGGRETYNAQDAHALSFVREKDRLNKIVKQLSDSTKQKIKEGVDKGYSLKFIAFYAQVNGTTLRTYLRKNNLVPVALGIRDPWEKITALEMQIQILAEQIEILMERK